MSTTHRKVSVLFVCLGNICRSPMAEAVFAHLVALNGLQHRFETIASAGTAAYHVDEEPDPRTVAVCKRHNVPVNSVAQQVQLSDFDTFDYILAMDTSNLRNLREMQPPQSKAQGQHLDHYHSPHRALRPCQSTLEFLDSLTFASGLPFSRGLLESSQVIR
ncbi:hypothetical protein PTTG_29573 [Puccinia triticina 1-1 BBBD Race 1]|uniref:Acid phosphatase n=1 Tax=Puccinia triticina (isolate 1-1 / race 1 (BBBD)) TaxID=630390 RepID=A0A180G328_PUCT1|nr:hypothetical protein PTTG_29573 [Puccinia triticina 1-1 BBBD Race 1]